MSRTPAPPTPLARLLVPLFAALEREELPYCVLRGWSELPERTRNDVDIAVAPGALERVCDRTEEIAREQGWLVVGRVRQHGFRRSLLFHPRHPGGVLPIDLCTSHEVWGLVYADSEEVLSGELRHEGIRVARPGCEAAVSLLKGLLRHAAVKKRPEHRERLQACVREDPDGFRACCAPLVGGALCDALLSQCERGGWQALEALSGRLRWTLARRQGALRAAARAITSALRTRLRSLTRRGGLEFRGGLFICLLGPDGSGKTTLARALEDRIGGLFARTEQFHSLSGVLPKLKGIKNAAYALRGRKAPPSPLKGVAMPGVVAKPMPAWRSTTYILYYGIEYVLYRWIVWRKMRRNHLVIFDRYFYDYYLMRIHLNAPRWLLGLFSRCIAQPDVLFVMLADPEAIFRRKPELTAEEIARQQAVLTGLRLPTAARIDTSISIEKTLEQALEVIEPLLRGEPLPRPRAT